MRRERLNIEEFLRGELSTEGAERVARLLEQDAGARAHAEWLGLLRSLTTGVRTSPPDEVVEGLQARLLSIPGSIEAGEIVVPVGISRPGRVRPMPSWLLYPAPALRVAATLLVGLLIGYGIWGTGSRRSPLQPAESETFLAEAARAPAADVSLTGSGSGMRGTTRLQELESRVEALERSILQAYFSKVEATMLHFITEVADGAVAAPSAANTRNLLSVTANLKAERKSANDVRMTQLLGQIEMVLMEMDRLSRERDLSGAQHVASVISEQGLLSTLQRLRVGVEE
jgi:hypothetical protein